MSDLEKGFVQGIAFAVGFLADNHDQDVFSFDIVKASDLEPIDFRLAMQHDLSKMRRSSSCKEFLKGIRGKY